MNRIAIIIPYFGKWPEWIDLYLFSCAHNSEIDWHFFTDCEIKIKGDNIFFYSISFFDYCKLVSDRLKINFKPNSAYKLCDLKPFLGYIHAEIILEYKFWGFGDVDVVWGNIKEFYTDKLLNQYDVFSTHADRLSGHLAILRNNKRLVESCFKIKNWKEKLELENNLALDETEFSSLLYPSSKYIRKFYGRIIRRILNWRDAWILYYNIMPFINFIFRIKHRKLYLKEQHTTPILSDDGLSCKHDADTWYYMNGEITNNKTSQKYIYLHFMIYKKNVFREKYYWKAPFFLVPKVYDYSKGVLITKDGIIANKD